MTEKAERALMMVQLLDEQLARATRVIEIQTKEIARLNADADARELLNRSLVEGMREFEEKHNNTLKVCATAYKAANERRLELLQQRNGLQDDLLHTANRVEEVEVALRYLLKVYGELYEIFFTKDNGWSHDRNRSESYAYTMAREVLEGGRPSESIRERYRGPSDQTAGCGAGGCCAGAGDTGSHSDAEGAEVLRGAA